MTRITPARAGKTRRGICSASHCRDHPRACGENIFQRLLHISAWGSPPRVRGKLCHRLGLDRSFRITPARAGKTYARFEAGWRSEDHPRACGENTVRATSRHVRPGSPPRVRGKPEANINRGLMLRITPARAGKTMKYGVFVLVNEDHPRACGENPAMMSWFSRCRGSPPRVRGKQWFPGQR